MVEDVVGARACLFVRPSVRSFVSWMEFDKKACKTDDRAYGSMRSGNNTGNKSNGCVEDE